jgi:GDP-D-mannose dehydratase
MKNREKNVLITGALGQDGVILTKILSKKKYNIIGWIRKNKNKFLPKIKYYKINLIDKEEVKKKLSKIKPNFIIHLASENPSFQERKTRKQKSNLNIIGTINLINAIKELNLNTLFIFANSSQIFSYKKKIKEKDKMQITNDYTKFRIKIYRYLKILKKKYNFRFTNLILFNHDSKYRNKKFLLPQIVSAVKNNNYNFLKKIYSYNIVSDFSHAEDICNAIYLVIKKKIAIDNLILSSGKKTEVNSLIKYLLKLSKKRTSFQRIKNKKTQNIIGNNNLAKKILKWKIKKNIYIAVKEMYKY